MRKIAFGLFLLVLPTSLIASNADSMAIQSLKKRSIKLFQQQKKYDSILVYLNKMGDLTLAGAYREDYMFSLLARFSVNYLIEDYSKAEFYMKECVNEANEHLDENHPYWKTIYNNLGSFQSLVGNHKESLALQNKSMKLLLKEPPSIENTIKHALYLQNIGTSYSLLGDFQKAIIYYEEAMNLAFDSLQSEPLLSMRISPCKYEIAHEYKSLGKYQTAISYYQENIEFTKKYNSNGLDVLIKTYISLADAYHSIGEFEKAFSSLQEARLLREEYKAIHNRDIRAVNFHNIQARCLASVGKFDLAFESNEKAIDLAIAENTISSRSQLAGRMHFFYGENLTKNKEWQKALTQFQKALIQFMSTYDSEDIFELPEKEDIRLLEEVTLKIFAEKSKTFYKLFKETQDQKYLQAAWEHSLFWIALIDDYRDQLQTEASQLFISEQLKPGFEHAIKLALTLYEQSEEQAYIEKAFEISEKSKAVLLYASLNTINAKYTASLPDSLVDMEYDLSTQISFYKKQVFDEGNKKLDCDDAKIEGWERKIFSLERKLDSLEQTFESNYPDYYALKYEKEPLSLKEIQKSIPNAKTLLLEYFVGNEATYIFALSRNKLEYRKLDYYPSLNEGIDAFLVDLHKVERKPVAIEAFQKRGQYLFSQLIGDEWADFETYTFIPDASLGLLPFELLLTEESKTKNYTQLPYFFKDRNIHYAYSAQLLFDDPRDSRDRTKASKGWAGFAPVFEGAKALNFNEGELQQIQQIMQGDAWMGAQADKESFLKNAHNYEVLHFATHAYPNQENPQFARLEFTSQDSLDEGILYAHELMNQRLAAKLVVLSACETGYGAIAPGEGIMSLARSFRYAGSPSILMSLWKAESSVSEKLMVSFYKYLNKGESKDEALRLAKQDYLVNPIPGREHPRYWANFVLIGDAEPLHQDLPWIWILVVVGILGLLGKSMLQKTP